MSFKVSVAALSDVGCVRKNNEDAYGYDSARNLFVVCDGVGGTLVVVALSRLSRQGT